MSLSSRLFTFTGKPRRLSAPRLIALAFLAIILTGALLLTLPIASRSGVSCGFFPALFTATSATCVTGLVLFDTWVQFSGFGQVVILCLIELGGLGFMSAACLVLFVLRRRVGLKERMVIAQALSLNDMEGVVRLQRIVLFGSLSIQGAGAVILFLRFLPDVGVKKALCWGVFHAVSAFCNAGFDIMGCIQPGGSIAPYGTDPVVCLTLMVLIWLGGLGFFVWEEVARVRSFKKFSVYTKLVLIMSGVLTLAGTVAFVFLEWNNPATMGEMAPWEKILASAFQSVTTRTAGFAGVDQGALTDASKAVSIVLMAIGGASGSTAGGMKMVTMMVLLLFLWSRARGKSSVCVFHRTIPERQVLDAMTITSIFILLCLFGSVFLSVASPMNFTDCLYETVSAMATVGLTAGGTPCLSIPAQVLIIIYMYFGRVGVLTISLGFLTGNRAEERFRYAQTNLLIG